MGLQLNVDNHCLLLAFSVTASGKMESYKQEGHGNRMESEAAPFTFAVRALLVRLQHGVTCVGIPACQLRACRAFGSPNAKRVVRFIQHSAA